MECLYQQQGKNEENMVNAHRKPKEEISQRDPRKVKCACLTNTFFKLLDNFKVQFSQGWYDKFISTLIFKLEPYVLSTKRKQRAT